MYILAWTINHGQNDLEDFFSLYENLDLARKEYEHMRKTEDLLHCAAISKVVLATEPHWEE
jgi:hypothetical protein